MNPAHHRAKPRPAARQGDWHAAERLGRAHGCSLLGRGLLRALAWMRRALRAALAPPDRSA